MSDWVIPLATFILAVPPSLVALYRSLWGRDHKRMKDLEDRILALENDLIICRSKNADLVEENFRLLKKIVEGPECPFDRCPLANSYSQPVKRHTPSPDRSASARSEPLPPNASCAPG